MELAMKTNIKTLQQPIPCLHDNLLLLTMENNSMKETHELVCEIVCTFVQRQSIISLEEHD
jgi:hypothetical protein